MQHNITIGIVERLRRPLLIDQPGKSAIMSEYGGKLSIRYSSPGQFVSDLSGGNQQKVILARSLAENCRVLLLAEPTRGVDVGAKQEIYTLIDMLVEQGIAVLLQSSELPGIAAAGRALHRLCRRQDARRAIWQAVHPTQRDGAGHRAGRHPGRAGYPGSEVS